MERLDRGRNRVIQGLQGRCRNLDNAWRHRGNGEGLEKMYIHLWAGCDPRKSLPMQALTPAFQRAGDLNSDLLSSKTLLSDSVSCCLRTVI